MTLYEIAYCARKLEKRAFYVLTGQLAGHQGAGVAMWNLQDAKTQFSTVVADALAVRHWIQRTELLFADRILPFDTPAARIWVRLSARIGHPGANLMIAASAVAHGMTVVSGNVSDFAPTDVPVFDPFAPC